MNTHMGLIGIVLAAGESSRLGQPKQCLNYKGTPLLIGVCNAIIPLCREVHCVVGAHQDLIRPLIPSNVRVVENKDWHQGMGASLATAMHHIPDWAKGIMITLTDQPLIELAHYAELVKRWDEDQTSMVTTRTTKREMPPLIIPIALRTDFLMLDGTVGGREIIAAGKNKGRSVPCDAAALDIDLPDDLERLISPVPTDKENLC